MKAAAPAPPFVAALASLAALSLATSGCDAPRPVQVPLGSEHIEGWFWEPPRSLAPALLLLDTAEPRPGNWSPLARRLRQEGYGVLALDLGTQNGQHDLLVAGVGAGFDFLREQKKVDAARIGLIGVDHGANAALEFSAREPLASLVVMLSPTPESAALPANSALRDYGFRPLLLIAAREDPLSVAIARQLAEAALGKAVVKYRPGSAHGTELLALGPPLEQEILAFLKDNL